MSVGSLRCCLRKPRRRSGKRELVILIKPTVIQSSYGGTNPAEAREYAESRARALE